MQRQQTGGRFKAFLILGFSLVLAGVAAVLVVRVVNQAQNQLKAASRPAQTVDVVVASRELYTGIVVTKEDVAIRPLVPEMVPKETSFASLDQVIGRTPRERILRGEIIRSERLAVKEAGIGLNAIISPGMRAMAIGVDAESGVGGFVQPGNWVDVVVVIRPDEKTVSAKWESNTILEKKRVLAVGRNMGSGEEEAGTKKKATTREKPTVTLEVTPDEGEILALSASKGDIYLALRNTADVEQVETDGARTGDLVADRPEPVRPPTATGPKGPTAEVILGSTVQEVTFDADGTKTVKTQGKKK